MNAQLPPPPVPRPTRRSTSRSTSRRIIAAGVGAGLLAGGAIGFVAGVPNPINAATPALIDETTEPTDDTGTGTGTDTGTGTGTGTETEAVGSADEGHGEHLRARLQPLVDDGTLDAAQADAVATYLANEWTDRGGPGGPGGRGGPGHRARPLLESIDTAVEVLGIDAETLRDELRAGNSLADIAEANGVDPQTLIDALVAEAEAMLDQAVADGRIDAEVADARRADLDERIAARVAGERPDRPSRFDDDTSDDTSDEEAGEDPGS